MRADKKEEITQQRRHQIMEAAIRLFSQKGYGETTIPDIADEACVAVGTVYNYFDSKRDLLVSLIITYVVDERLMELLGRSDNIDDETWLRDCIDDRIEFGFENHEKFFFIFNEIQRDSQLRQIYGEKVFLPAMAHLEQYLESRKSSGSFRNINSAIVARAIVGMLIGFNLLYRIEEDKALYENVSRQNLVHTLTDLILRGLQVRED